MPNQDGSTSEITPRIGSGFVGYLTVRYRTFGNYIENEDGSYEGAAIRLADNPDYELGKSDKKFITEVVAERVVCKEIESLEGGKTKGLGGEIIISNSYPVFSIKKLGEV